MTTVAFGVFDHQVHDAHGGGELGVAGRAEAKAARLRRLPALIILALVAQVLVVGGGPTGAPQPAFAASLCLWHRFIAGRINLVVFVVIRVGLKAPPEIAFLLLLLGPGPVHLHRRGPSGTEDRARADFLLVEAFLEVELVAKVWRVERRDPSVTEADHLALKPLVAT